MIKNKKTFYLTNKNKKRIDNAKTFYELVAIGHEILDRMQQPVVQVCGPISTGGKGSVGENLASLTKAINDLTSKGLNVFNQLLFERAFDRILGDYKVGVYDTPILEEFYGPIFESGKIKGIYLLPGWRKSIGARWEYNCAKKLGMKINFYHESKKIILAKCQYYFF